MQKIDVKTIDRKNGMYMDDLLREGVAPSHDRIKVAAVIQALVNQVNELIDKVSELEHRG